MQYCLCLYFLPKLSIWDSWSYLRNCLYLQKKISSSSYWYVFRRFCSSFPEKIRWLTIFWCSSRSYFNKFRLPQIWTLCKRGISTIIFFIKIQKVTDVCDIIMARRILWDHWNCRQSIWSNCSLSMGVNDETRSKRIYKECSCHQQW